MGPVIVGILALAALLLIVVACAIYYIGIGIWNGWAWLMDWITARRRARIEAELDRKQEELRGAVLRLAGALSTEAHEARRALIRESYLASGRLPEQR